jgi:hypothetical protein
MRDGHFSYLHLQDPSHVLYLERWRDEPIAHDDIDPPALLEASAAMFPKFLLEEEEDGGIPILLSTIGTKILKDRRLLKERTWHDLAVHERFALHPDPRWRDHTVLAAATDDADATLARFMANGYALAEEPPAAASPANDSLGDLSHSDLAAYARPAVQTPRPPRTRQLLSDRFQTPITRIIR